ncbi:putative NBD/HSP70 family sugar kinase [Microbacterium sp. SORGH_AS428]|uniref:ROK family transcriptional regulator n=1 Tax=Microbacterium sp. SORGH_AS_0428 TaxID=3041788 RepID=UPI00285ADCB4|nr:ROK family transcriptional regulator [Microbacterium sp. SORGH_AS_0428]MDR6200450.1 putative NBD/HSP70 family sugar kinase [Microbacterium sp. SORGH_AS_0428]
MNTFGDVAGEDAASTRRRVLAAVRDDGPISRADLARATGLAASTITAVTKALVAEGVLHESGDGGEGGRIRTGPRSRGLVIAPRLASVAGVDFGFRTVRVAICDLDAQVLALRESRLTERYSSDEGLSAAARLYAEALEEAGLPPNDIVTIGVALPGPIDSVAQRIIGSSVLPGWSDTTVETISQAFGAPTVIENDANLAALGEHTFGAGRDVQDSLTVKFHSGVGAGLIIQDRLVTGAGSGEIGHFTVSAQGSICRCGKRGCLDTFAAIPALLDAMPAEGAADVRTLLALVADGDARARRVVSDAADLVGDAASRACLLFAPQRVIIVGAMAQAGDAVIDPLARALRRGLIPDAEAGPAVVRGELAERSTLMGAIALALASSGWLPLSG